MGAMEIRTARPAEAAALADIYNHFVQHTIVTFEEEPVAAAEFAARVAEVEAAGLPFLVAEADGRVAGYAYASKWKGRCGYRFSAEVSVYLAPDRARQGIGTALYGELFPMLQARRLHAVIGGIALPNHASVALHEKFGMTPVARFPEVGFKFGRWIDVGYWQRLFGA